jgi:very-short-patch-repair endonuclease
VRQVPLGPYVVDFLCRAERLVVELDGEEHAENERDLRRTAWLNEHGYSVWRFWNFEALRK